MRCEISIMNVKWQNQRQNHTKTMMRGFSLIELMIVVSIIAILAAIAVPSYQQYVIRSNRVAAQSQMLEIANRQQQFLIANRSYADSATLAASGFSLPPEVSSKYDFTMAVNAAATPPTYTITFTPKGSQSSDGVITLDSVGNKLPANKW